jgi:erythromycin esterase
MKAALLLLLLASEPTDGPYVTVYRDDHVAFQMRRDRVMELGNRQYRVWLRWLWAEPRRWQSDLETATVRFVDLDCNALRVRDLAVLHKNAKGEIYDSEELEPERSEWKSAARDSGAGAALAKVCECAPQLARMQWLAQHAVPIRSVDPDDGDFQDLEPLRAALQGVRVVMLGEQTHGDGTTFLAKARLIRFLHEQLGFDVLVFESGLYDCAKAQDRLAAGEAPRDAFARCVFRIWTASAQVQPVIDYTGKRGLELAGADIQFSGSAAGDFLLGDLSRFLSTIDPKLAEGAAWERVAWVIDELVANAWELGLEGVPPPGEQAAFAETIEQWRAAIAACDASPATVPWSGSFWRQFLTSLRVTAEQMWRTSPADHTRDADVFAMRDLQMGKNLVWLAKERYPNRRIIVWGATFHNARNLGTIETGDPKYARLYPATSPMGEVAWRELGRELYSLGFLSFEGEHGSVFTRTARPVPPASAGSLEDLLAQAGHRFAFVDFRATPAWLREPLAAKLLGYVEMRADWTRIVDGIVFIRTMERSRK